MLSEDLYSVTTAGDKFPPIASKSDVSPELACYLKLDSQLLYIFHKYYKAVCHIHILQQGSNCIMGKIPL